MSNARSNIRSFRFSDDVLKILNDFEGNSLNDKFNNLVAHCFELLPLRTKELKQINKDIADRREYYYKICSKLTELQSLISCLETIKHYGDIARKRSDSLFPDDSGK